MKWPFKWKVVLLVIYHGLLVISVQIFIERIVTCYEGLCEILDPKIRI